MVREIKISAFVCEICGREFLDKVEAQRCEDAHIAPELRFPARPGNEF